MAAVTGAVIGAATTLYSANQARKQQKDAQKFANQQMEALDPFAEHRPYYADQLRALTDDPSKIQDTATYKARLMAAERTMASQGYTGSGNALVAAADAGASAYAQEMEYLMALSGAAQGQGARASAYGTAAGANSNANDNYLGAIGGIGNSIVGISGMFGGSRGGVSAATGGNFNKTITNTGFGGYKNPQGGG